MKRELVSRLFNVLILLVTIFVSYPIFNNDEMAYASETAKYYEGYIAQETSAFENDLNVLVNQNNNEYRIQINNISNNNYSFVLYIISTDDISIIKDGQNVDNRMTKDRIFIEKYIINGKETKQCILNIDTNSTFKFHIEEV